jgi:hypothetical protein
MSIQVDGFKTLLEVHKIANADTVAKAKLTACEITACIASFPPMPRSTDATVVQSGVAPGAGGEGANDDTESLSLAPRHRNRPHGTQLLTELIRVFYAGGKKRGGSRWSDLISLDWSTGFEFLTVSSRV